MSFGDTSYIKLIKHHQWMTHLSHTIYKQKYKIEMYVYIKRLFIVFMQSTVRAEIFYWQMSMRSFMPHRSFWSCQNVRKSTWHIFAKIHEIHETCILLYFTFFHHTRDIKYNFSRILIYKHQRYLYHTFNILQLINRLTLVN